MSGDRIYFLPDIYEMIYLFKNLFYHNGGRRRSRRDLGEESIRYREKNYVYEIFIRRGLKHVHDNQRNRKCTEGMETAAFTSELPGSSVQSQSLRGFFFSSAAAGRRLLIVVLSESGWFASVRTSEERSHCRQISHVTEKAPTQRKTHEFRVTDQHRLPLVYVVCFWKFVEKENVQ